jgi:hypothetical protein
MQLLHAGLNASHAMVRLKIAELLPDAGIFSGLGYGYNTINPAQKPPNGYIPQPPGALGGGFAFAMHEHLDLGVGLGRVSQVRHEDRANRARAEQALGGIAIEVAKTWSDFREAVGRANVTDRGVTATRGWVISVDEDLSAGIYRDVREMTDSFRQWTEWRIRHAQAVCDANISYAVLRRASDLDGDHVDHLAAELTGRQP